jgi:hypothetical protein
VYSAYRFVERHSLRSPTPKPLAIINLGQTRIERAGASVIKADLSCEETLAAYVQHARGSGGSAMRR